MSAHAKSLQDFLNTQRQVLQFLDAIQIQVTQVQHQNDCAYLLFFLNCEKKVLIYLNQRRNESNTYQNKITKFEKNYMVANKLFQCNFPVLKPLFYCDDVDILGTQFYGVEYMDGRIFDDQKFIGLDGASQCQILQEATKILKTLHTINLNYWGIMNFQKAGEYYSQFAEQIYNLYKINETKISTHIEDLLYWFQLNAIQVHNKDNVCLLHGNFSISNILFDPVELKIIAILDWSQAHIGNCFSELSHFIIPYFIPFSNEQQKISGWKNIQSLIKIPSFENIISNYFLSEDLSIIPEINPIILQQILRKAVEQQVMYNSTKIQQYLKNSEYLAEIGYILLNEMTSNNPYNIISRSSMDQNLWSKWQVSDRCKSLYYRIKDFMKNELFPIESQILKKISAYPEQILNKGIVEIEELQQKAKSQGLWNLFISDPHYGRGLTNLEYVFISELMGTSYIGHEVFNCFAPDTGNIKLLIGYGTNYQKQKYLQPLLEGNCKSFFAMTEKEVSSSDPNNFQLTILPTKNGYIVNGKKWFVASAPDERVKFGIIMGKSSLDNTNLVESQSMIIVDIPNSNVKIIRQVSMFGFYDLPHSYAEMHFDNVFIPSENLLGQLGGAFKMAQGRLLGGRLHHCVKLLGLTRRSIDLILERSQQRIIQKQAQSKNESFQEKLGRMEIDFQTCRLLCINGGQLLDSLGSKHLQTFLAISQCKAYIPKACQDIIDCCIQAFGAQGVTEDQPLTMGWRFARAIRFMDGPCELHLKQTARFAFGNHLFNELQNAEGYGISKL